MKKALTSLRILLATVLFAAAAIMARQSAMAVRNDESTTPTATPLPRFTPPPVRTPTPRPGPTEVIIGPGGIAVTPQTGPSASPSTGLLDPTKGKLIINPNPVPVNNNLIVTDGGEFKTGQLINGTLLCPITSSTPPLMLVKGCTTFVGTPPKWASKAYGPATLRGQATDGKCDNYGRAAGQGYAFYDSTNGQCWSCPVLTHRNIGIIPVDSKDPKFPACTAGNEDGIVWQSAQFPEPGVAAFADTLIVQLAFKDPGFVDAFLSKRQRASRTKNDIWSAMIDSPNDSPEFKALIFAAILAAAEKDPSYTARPGNAVSRFEDYVQKRRTYVAQDAVLMYNAYLEFNAYKQYQGAKATALAGGPMAFASAATGAVIQSPSAGLANLVGIPPDDYVNAAYSAAVPDQRGEEFIRALVDMGGTEYKSPGGTTTTTVDPVATAQLAINIVSSAIAIHDALEDLKVIKGISALGGKTGLGIGLGMGLAGTVLDGIQGAMTLFAQLEADQQYSQLLQIAAKPVNIAQIMKSGTDEDKNSLIMWWALATSGYKASGTVREFPINHAAVCANYPTQCSDIKAVVMKAKPVAAPVQLPAPPELIGQIDATKALAQLLSGVNNAASATAAKPQITAAVAQANQFAASVKALTGPAWGGANQHRAEIAAAIAQVKKEMTRIQGLPDAYPVIQGALAPLKLTLPGGPAPGP
jgi:hypothetical protein